MELFDLSDTHRSLASWRRILSCTVAAVALWYGTAANAQSISGACGTTASTCAKGTVNDSTDNGISTSWTCLGNGGSNAWCSIQNPTVARVNGACGTAPDSCSAGTVTGSSNNGISTSWTCSGSHSGSNAWCSLPDSRVAVAAVNGACGTAVNSCTAGTVTGSEDHGTTESWTCSGINHGSSSFCSVSLSAAQPAPSSGSGLVGSKLGINLAWITDWSDREMMFVDVMKNARGFAVPAYYWDPTNHPVAVDAKGWPTTDFGIVFISSPGDPLGRPLTATFPSFFGTYSLSFTGRATVAGAGCCTIHNLEYNAQTNVTTANVVVGQTDTLLALTFTGTHDGVQNVKLLRPGYTSGTTQVFTTQFLNAVAPFSTLRLMDTLETNGNPVTSWAQRTQPSSPQQSALSGLAWEYVIQLANKTGKDIWINIPQGVNLADPSSANYGTQLAMLLKNTLNPGIHVYLEYSNEVWNSSFPQNQANLNDANSEVRSGADPTLNYDNVNNQWYWGLRRVMHQAVRLSQLFRDVYGAAAMNTTIRPLYLSQYVQPYLAEDGLTYLRNNFGAPNHFLYGIGGAPYVSGPANSYPDASSAVAGVAAGLTSVESGFPALSYTGGASYTNLSYKGFADYYGLKSVAYEGGPGLAGSTAAVSEQAESNSELKSIIESYLSDWYGCGNDLFMYFDLAEPPGNIYGVYEDLANSTPKSVALSTLAKESLSNMTTCNAQK